VCDTEIVGVEDQQLGAGGMPESLGDRRRLGGRAEARRSSAMDTQRTSFMEAPEIVEGLTV
jgi:hypothetical protein